MALKEYFQNKELLKQCNNTALKKYEQLISDKIQICTSRNLYTSRRIDNTCQICETSETIICYQYHSYTSIRVCLECDKIFNQDKINNHHKKYALWKFEIAKNIEIPLDILFTIFKKYILYFWHLELNKTFIPLKDIISLQEK